MGVYLRTKFQVSSIILTIFRQEGGGRVILPLPYPTSKQTPKKPTQIRVNQSEFYLEWEIVTKFRF